MAPRREGEASKNVRKKYRWTISGRGSDRWHFFSLVPACGRI